MYRVLVTDTDMPSFEIEEEVLRPLDAKVWLAPASDEQTLINEASQADAIMVGYVPVSEAVIAAAATAGCRAIVRYGIGYDNVDISAAERHGIPVANVPDYCLDEVADHTMALLLVYARGLGEATRSVREARRAVGDMRGNEPGTADLVTALQELVQRESSRTSAHLCWKLEGEPRELPGHIAESLFRIGREALSNAIRHANATCVEVSLSLAHDFLRLRVKDPVSAAEHSGIGESIGESQPRRPVVAVREPDTGPQIGLEHNTGDIALDGRLVARRSAI